MALNLMFDVDGTLYSFRKTGIGKQMRKRITEFLSHEFKISLEEADAMADVHYKKYGLTARGIQVELGVPEMTLKSYCAYCHMIDYEAIAYSHELVEAFTALSKIPGVKIWALTNATKQHAAATLSHIGISNAFRCADTGALRIIDCFMQWANSPPPEIAECKPQRSAYELGERKARLSKDDTFVMIEDALRNLDAPKLMGWKTVFIGDQRDELVQEAKEHGHDCIVDGIMDAMPYFFELAKSARDVDGSAAAAAAAAHQGEKDE